MNCSPNCSVNYTCSSCLAVLRTQPLLGVDCRCPLPEAAPPRTACSSSATQARHSCGLGLWVQAPFCAPGCHGLQPAGAESMLKRYLPCPHLPGQELSKLHNSTARRVTTAACEAKRNCLSKIFHIVSHHVSAPQLAAQRRAGGPHCAASGARNAQKKHAQKAEGDPRLAKNCRQNYRERAAHNRGTLLRRTKRGGQKGQNAISRLTTLMNFKNYR